MFELAQIWQDLGNHSALASFYTYPLNLKIFKVSCLYWKWPFQMTSELDKNLHNQLGMVWQGSRSIFVVDKFDDVTTSNNNISTSTLLWC